MNPLLFVAERLYWSVNAIRRDLYRRGLLRSQRLPVPVISVGNIAIGGSGKTPLVIAIARHLLAKGRSVAILTRGYGRPGRASGAVGSFDAAEWGDEPVLMKKQLENVDIIVGHDRFNKASDYLAYKQVSLFLLDDGFQHLQLHRDLDVVIDHPAAAHYRESRKALRDADLILVRGGDYVVHPNVPSAWKNRRVYAFAGLADNEQFFTSLRAAGLQVVGTRSFPDHHFYADDEIALIKRDAAAAGADLIVTTEKDAVKIDDPSIVAVGATTLIDPRFFERLEALLERHGA